MNNHVFNWKMVIIIIFFLKNFINGKMKKIIDLFHLSLSFSAHFVCKTKYKTGRILVKTHHCALLPMSSAENYHGQCHWWFIWLLAATILHGKAFWPAHSAHSARAGSWVTDIFCVKIPGQMISTRAHWWFIVFAGEIDVKRGFIIGYNASETGLLCSITLCHHFDSDGVKDYCRCCHLTKCQLIITLEELIPQIQLTNS